MLTTLFFDQLCLSKCEFNVKSRLDPSKDFRQFIDF